MRELARDWFDVFLTGRVGVDSDVQIREKKNLTGIFYDVDETDVVKHIMPTGKEADGNKIVPNSYEDFGKIVMLHYIIFCQSTTASTCSR